MKSFVIDSIDMDQEDKVINLIDQSEAAKFYDELFSDKHIKIERPELHEEVTQATNEKYDTEKALDGLLTFLEMELSKDAIIIEIGGGVHQRRSAFAYKRFKNYFPLDISYSSIKKYTDTFQRKGFVADAKKLPFKDNSIDCIFTHTFLEHPLEPENVLKEIVRVLKVGGIVIHNDAWFCRWWQRYGVVGLKRFQNMTIGEKALWFAAKVTELSVVRIPPIVINRTINHFSTSLTQPIKLKYSKLNPNYSLHLGCDEDAANRIDPINVVRFYESRGFNMVKPISLKDRLFYPNQYIMLRKNK